jgi:GABA(A) receptor-associated protein
MTIPAFKKKFSFAERVNEVQRIREKYPDRIPIIVEKLNNSKAPFIDKNKYLVPFDLTVGQFIYVIRKRMSLPSEQALYIFIKDSIPSSSSLMLNLYEWYKDNDGYLYVFYSSENTFGTFDTKSKLKSK